jgi:hypothetical protein
MPVVLTITGVPRICVTASTIKKKIDAGSVSGMTGIREAISDRPEVEMYTLRAVGS